jgi:hypothetical protein
MGKNSSWIDRLLAGAWPTRSSGEIPEAPGETWQYIEGALIKGRRGLNAGSSLAKLLARRHRKRSRLALPDLNPDDIEAWSRSYFARRGVWPGFSQGGIVDEAPEESWRNIDAAFEHGRRGLSTYGYKSLSDFLDKRIGKLVARPGKFWLRILNQPAA